MSYSTMPIVGAFYRPPAKILLDHLPVGQPLTLSAEPDNQYDPNAVAVWLNAVELPLAAQESLEQVLPQFGFSIDQVLSQGFWHLGYIPKDLAASLKSAGIVPDGKTIEVTFAVNGKGGPLVQFLEPVL